MAEQGIKEGKLKITKKQKTYNNSEEKVKELLEEIEKLKRKIKTLKSKKKYGLVWEEEKEPEQIVLDCQYKIPILKEVSTKKIITDKKKPMNILIEGDNYHALSVLNYTHKGKIDVIYIDPPYNTGKTNEWKFNDRYVDENDVYKHSKWLSFMNSRLKLAKNLLKKKGVIFISIDDHEYAQLKLLCDEIFGEENFVTTIIWKSRSSLQYSEPLISSQTEYILLYCKNKKKWNSNGGLRFNRIKKETDGINYSNPDNDPRGKWTSSGLIRDDGRKKYTITTPSGKKYTEAWLYTEENMKKFISEGLLWFGKKGDAKPRKKSYWADHIGRVSSNLLEDEFIISRDSQGEFKKKKLFEIGTTELGTKELKNIFILTRSPFDYPKPSTLIKYLLNLYPSKKITVLDFFAGTGTTGHATLKLNKEDGGDRKFILCTNNENNICTEICYPRINKVIKGYKNLKDEQVKGLSGNLRYFKTELLDVDHISHVSDEQKIKLTYKAGEVIALREDTFEEVEKNEWWQIFKNGTKYTAIYFKEDKKKLSKLVKKLGKLKEKIALYIFSWGKNEYKNEFTEYKNIRVEDIPEPIIDVYKEINRLS